MQQPEQKTIHILWVDRQDIKTKTSYFSYVNYSDNCDTLVKKANFKFNNWTSKRATWKPESLMHTHYCSQDEWKQTILDNPTDFENVQREDFIIETHSGTTEHINSILAKYHIM